MHTNTTATLALGYIRGALGHMSDDQPDAAIECLLEAELELEKIADAEEHQARGEVMVAAAVDDARRKA